MLQQIVSSALQEEYLEVALQCPHGHGWNPQQYIVATRTVTCSLHFPFFYHDLPTPQLKPIGPQNFDQDIRKAHFVGPLVHI